MSHDPKYYNWLYSIDGSANPGRCLVLNELPFASPMSAISFVTKAFPEMTPEEHPINADSERASEIASHSQHELEYILKMLEEMVEDLKKDAEREEKHAAECGNSNLFDRVQQSLYEEYARDKRNQAVGVTQALIAIRTRKMELSTMAGKGRYSDWRI